MQTINERFKLIVERWYRGNDLAFAKSMGKFSSSFSKIINGSVNPRASTLQAVCRTIPELSPTWLLTGEGSMLRDGKTDNKQYSTDEMQRVKDELEQKNELIMILKQQVQDLRDFNQILRNASVASKQD